MEDLARPTRFTGNRTRARNLRRGRPRDARPDRWRRPSADHHRRARSGHRDGRSRVRSRSAAAGASDVRKASAALPRDRGRGRRCGCDRGHPRRAAPPGGGDAARRRRCVRELGAAGEGHLLLREDRYAALHEPRWGATRSSCPPFRRWTFASSARRTARSLPRSTGSFSWASCSLRCRSFASWFPRGSPGSSSRSRP